MLKCEFQNAREAAPGGTWSYAAGEGEQKKATLKLRNLSGAPLLIALTIGPWLGGLSAWSISLLSILSSLSVAMWLWTFVSDRTALSRGWWAALIAVMGLLGCGALSAGLATAHYDAGLGRLVIERQRIDWLPSTVDRWETLRVLWQVGPALLAMLVMADLAADRVWRERLIRAIALGGASLAAYGLAQKLGFWPPLAQDNGDPRSAFATLRDHGVAAVYLNLSLAAAVAASLWAVRTRDTFLYISAAGIIVIGGAFNISKAGSVAMLLEVLLIVTPLLIAIYRDRGSRLRRYTSGGVAAGLVAMCAVLVLSGRVSDWKKIVYSAGAGSGRRIMSRIAAHIALHGGLFGWGPGSFKLIYPNSTYFDPRLYAKWIVTRHVPGQPVSQWSFAYNDWLQIWAEWGAVGLGLLIIIGVAGMTGFIRTLSGQHPRRVKLGAWSLLVGVLVMVAHAFGEWPLQWVVTQMLICTIVAVGIALADKKSRFA